jgi:hypothetical protein
VHEDDAAEDRTDQKAAKMLRRHRALLLTRLLT